MSALWRHLTLLRTFALLSALILVVFAVLLAWNLGDQMAGAALDQEITQAEGQAQGLLHAGLLPQNTGHALSPEILHHLAVYTADNLKYGGNVRVKIWPPDGTILYSDAAAAIGKRYPLGDDEREVLKERLEMEQHPLIGHELLRALPFLADELAIIRNHHERWDGRGYPDALAGEAIPVLARIVGVADSFDAMTSDRPYRPGMALSTAREQLLRGAGSQFWSPAVTACVALLESGELGGVPAESPGAQELPTRDVPAFTGDTPSPAARSAGFTM